MPDANRVVAIDTDFFIKFTELDEKRTLFERVMEALQVELVMHSYVFKYELKHSQIAKEMVDSGYIKVYSEADFLSEDRAVYEMLFRTAYKSFNHVEFEHDFYQYKHAGESLGEIRTALMALSMGIDLMMTDDREAKTYISNRISSARNKIEVCTILDVLMKVDELKKSGIEWKEVKGFAKRVLVKKDGRRNVKAYETLRSKWMI